MKYSREEIIYTIGVIATITDSEASREVIDEMKGYLDNSTVVGRMSIGESDASITNMKCFEGKDTDDILELEEIDEKESMEIDMEKAACNLDAIFETLFE